MPQQTHTVVTRQSWFSRLGGAFRGIAVGVVLVLFAFGFLFWNEGRAVRRYKALKEGAGAVVSVSADRIDPVREGALVHFSGLATTDEMLADPEFGIYVNAIHLEREVEMYQWRENETSETKKKVGGGTETTTTYSYTQTWSSRAIASSGFQLPSGHENPGSMPYEARKVSAQEVKVGAFQLSPGLIAGIRGAQPLSVDSLSGLPGSLRWRAKLHGGGLYVGRNPAAPEIGDLRITFQVVKPAVVSVVAQQAADRVQPYHTRSGGSVELLASGSVGADAMFEAAQHANRVTTWIFRVFGFLVMMWGLRKIFRPLSVLADVLPALGNLAETGIGAFSFFLAGFLSLVTIAVAWLFYRPLLALLLLILAGGAVVGVVLLVRKARRSAVPPPPPPVPAPAAG